MEKITREKLAPLEKDTLEMMVVDLADALKGARARRMDDLRSLKALAEATGSLVSVKYCDEEIAILAEIGGDKGK